jgi:hypothetical protein
MFRRLKRKYHPDEKENMKPEIDTIGGTPLEETAPSSVRGIQGRLTETVTQGNGWSSSRSRSGWRFVRHLMEMIAAMIVGMMMLGVAVATLGEPPGYSNLLVEYGLMGASMSVAMVAWMRFRGHAWSDGLEMTAAMLVPMVAVVTPFGWGAAGEASGQSDHALMMLSHVTMVGGMVALMIYRRDRYTHGTGG